MKNTALMFMMVCAVQVHAMEPESSVKQQLWLFQLPKHVQNKIYTYVFAAWLQDQPYTWPLKKSAPRDRRQKKEIVMQRVLRNMVPDLVGVIYEPFELNRSIAVILHEKNHDASAVLVTSLSEKNLEDATLVVPPMGHRLPNSLSRKPLAARLDLRITPDAYAEGYELDEDFKLSKPYRRIAVSRDGNTIALADHHQLFLFRPHEKDDRKVAELALYRIKPEAPNQDGSIFFDQIRILDFDVTGKLVGWRSQASQKAPSHVNIVPVLPTESHGNLLRSYCEFRAICKQ